MGADWLILHVRQSSRSQNWAVTSTSWGTTTRKLAKAKRPKKAQPEPPPKTRPASSLQKRPKNNHFPATQSYSLHSRERQPQP